MCDERNFEDHLIHSKGPDRPDRSESSQSRSEAAADQQKPEAEFEGWAGRKLKTPPSRRRPYRGRDWARRPGALKGWVSGLPIPTDKQVKKTLRNSGYYDQQAPEPDKSTDEPIEVTKELSDLSKKLQPEEVE